MSFGDEIMKIYGNRSNKEKQTYKIGSTVNVDSSVFRNRNQGLVRAVILEKLTNGKLRIAPPDNPNLIIDIEPNQVKG
jgi:hypothetical protein